MPDSPPARDLTFAARRRRFRELPPEILALIFSAEGRDCGARRIWVHSKSSPVPLRLMRLFVGKTLAFSLWRSALRNWCWRRLNPRLREIAHGTTGCLMPDPNHPDRVFKLDLHSMFYDRTAQLSRMRALERIHHTVLGHLGAFLEPMDFQQRNIARPGGDPLWATGAAQRRVVGTPVVIDTPHLPTVLRADSSLASQWAELCAAVLETERVTGWLADLYGPGNVLIERDPAGHARLVVVDSLPFLPSDEVVDDFERQHRRDVRAGLAAGMVS